MSQVCSTLWLIHCPETNMSPWLLFQSTTGNGPSTIRLWSSFFLEFDYPTLDLFASRTNYILPIWFSWSSDTGAWAWNAFSKNGICSLMLSRHMPSYIRSFRRYIRSDFSSSWSPSTGHTFLGYRISWKCQDLLFQQGSFHDHPKFWQLTAWKVSGDHTLPRAFRQRFSKLSKRPVEPALWEPTRVYGQCSVAGVVSELLIPFGQMSLLLFIFNYMFLDGKAFVPSGVTLQLCLLFMGGLMVPLLAVILILLLFLQGFLGVDLLLRKFIPVGIWTWSCLFCLLMFLSLHLLPLWPTGLLRLFFWWPSHLSHVVVNFRF